MSAVSSSQNKPLFREFTQARMRLYEQSGDEFVNIETPNKDPSMSKTAKFDGAPGYEWKGSCRQWMHWVLTGGSYTHFTIPSIRQGQKVCYVFRENGAKEYVSRCRISLQDKLQRTLPDHTGIKNMRRDDIASLFQFVMTNTNELPRGCKKVAAATVPPSLSQRTYEGKEGTYDSGLIRRGAAGTSGPSFQPERTGKTTSRRTDLATRKLAQVLSGTKETYGHAVDNGDCFYDAISQRLTAQLKRSRYNPVTVKELRKVVLNEVEMLHKNAPTNNWIYKMLKNKDAYDEFLALVGKPVSELDPKELPIWGRLNLEGQIIAEHYQTQIQLCEIQVLDHKIPSHEFCGLKKMYDGMQYDISYTVDGGYSTQLYKACEPNWSEVNPTSSKPLHTIKIALYPGHFVPIQPAYSGS